MAVFAVWCANFSAKLTATPVTYGLIAGDAVIVAGVAAPFAAAYAISSVPVTRTSATIATTNAARAAAEAVIRPYATRISANPTVDDADKVIIGVTLRATGRTPVPAPVDAPNLAVMSQIPLSARFEYATPGVVGKSKPDGAISVEVRQSIGVVAATDPDQCTHIADFTKSPFNLAYGAGDQGKISTLFARFKTRSGPQGISQSGPWSAPLVTHVA